MLGEKGAHPNDDGFWYKDNVKTDKKIICMFATEEYGKVKIWVNKVGNHYNPFIGNKKHDCPKLIRDLEFKYHNITNIVTKKITQIKKELCSFVEKYKSNEAVVPIGIVEKSNSRLVVYLEEFLQYDQYSKENKKFSKFFEDNSIDFLFNNNSDAERIYYLLKREIQLYKKSALFRDVLLKLINDFYKISPLCSGSTGDTYINMSSYHVIKCIIINNRYYWVTTRSEEYGGLYGGLSFIDEPEKIYV